MKASNRDFKTFLKPHPRCTSENFASVPPLFFVTKKRTKNSAAPTRAVTEIIVIVLICPGSQGSHFVAVALEIVKERLPLEDTFVPINDATTANATAIQNPADLISNVGLYSSYFALEKNLVLMTIERRAIIATTADTVARVVNAIAQ